jgi:sugar/nucleoside kinase (ribokinase family)
MVTKASPPVEVDVVIIGDAFVDLLCVVDAERKKEFSRKSEHTEENDSAVINPGGDVLLKYPISMMAGGSGINTATHLYSLLKQFRKDLNFNVEIQTVFNEDDMYGKLLRRHASTIGFTLCNQWGCGQKESPNNSSEQESNMGDCTPNQLATGHCVVVSQDGERSFLTHRGCVEYFSPHHVNLSRLLDTKASRINPSPALILDRTTLCRQHVHIAGYYNLPRFWNGNLKGLLQLINRKHRNELDSSLSLTTTISLVPQFDATHQWDGQILDLLIDIDYLILSENEARCITRFHTECDEDDEKLLNHVAQMLNMRSPTARTIIIVTLGSRGAAALQTGRIIYQYPLPILPDEVIDTTGAGDAFTGGFLAALMLDDTATRKEVMGNALQDFEHKLLENAIRFGCATGTACTLKKGASDPSTKEEIEHFIGLGNNQVA